MIKIKHWISLHSYQLLSKIIKIQKVVRNICILIFIPFAYMINILNLNLVIYIKFFLYFNLNIFQCCMIRFFLIRHIRFLGFFNNLLLKA